MEDECVEVCDDSVRNDKETEKRDCWVYYTKADMLGFMNMRVCDSIRWMKGAITPSPLNPPLAPLSQLSNIKKK
ncbi:hypothetical protein JOQ06_000462, partial [Pogonophryne albipinna]